MGIIFLTLIWILNILILDNFEFIFHIEVTRANYFLFLSQVELKKLLEKNPTLVLMLGSLISVIRHLKDLSIELLIIMSLSVMWLISVDFKARVEKTVAASSEDAFQSVIQQYREIRRLTLVHGRGHSVPVFCYFLEGVMYYSLNLGQLFSTPSFGSFIYDVEYFTTLTAISVLAGSFIYNVSEEKQILQIINYKLVIKIIFILLLCT